MVAPIRRKEMACHYIEEHGEDFDVVAVFGGDGTLNEATNGLMKLEQLGKRRCLI